MGQLHFYQLQLNYNYIQLGQLKYNQLKQLLLKPITIIAVTKLSVMITVTFQSELTTSLLVSPAVVHLLFEFFIDIKNNTLK